MENELNENILQELQRISKILIFNHTKEMNQTQTIEFMARFGYTPKEMADILGTTSNTVSVALSRKKKSNDK